MLQDRRQPFEEVPSPIESESDEEPVPPLGAQRSPQSPEPSALDRLRAIVSEHGDAQDSQVSTLANADLPSRTPTMEMPLVYDSIRNIIEHLYTLSMVIRRPIPTDRLAKLARFPVPYLFSPRKSPPTPIGHLGEGAHKAPTNIITILPSFLLFYTTTFASFIGPREAGLAMKVN